MINIALKALAMNESKIINLQSRRFYEFKNFTERLTAFSTEVTNTYFAGKV